MIPIFHKRGYENGALKVRFQETGIPGTHKRPQGQGWAMDEEGYSYVTFTRPTNPNFYQGIAIKNGAMYVSTTTSDDDYWSNGLRIGRDGSLKVGVPSGNSDGIQVIGGKLSVAGLTFFAGFADLGSGEVDLTALASDDTATFTRATAATTVNSAGTIISVASGVPRSYYDPTTLAYMGYLAEGARTNLLLNSTIDGANLATQDVTVTNVAHTISFYGTGTVTLSGTSTAGPLVGTGDYPERVQLTFTPTAGTLTVTVSGDVKYANLETGSFASSFIPTAGATVARNADVLTYPFTGNADATQGTAYLEINSGPLSGSKPFLSINDGTVNNRIAHFIDDSVGHQFLYQNAGSVLANLQIGGAAAFTNYKRAASWKTNKFAQVVNGGTVSMDLDGTISVAAMTRIAIGFDDTSYAFGALKNIGIYDTQFTSTQLVDMTS